MKRSLKDIIRRTVRVIEKDIIDPVAKANNISPVKILWGEIAIEDLDSRASRLVRYAKAGLLTPDKGIEALIRKIEELPEVSKSADKNSGKRTSSSDK